MKKTVKRPAIEVTAVHEGNATIFDVFGKVYAHIFREKLNNGKIAPLQEKHKNNKLKSS